MAAGHAGDGVVEQRREAQPDADRRQHEAEEQAAGVAHKDMARLEVVVEEAQARPGQRQRQGSQQPLAAHQAQQEEEKGGPARDSAGQTVHIVHQIERVGDADHPQHRHRHIQWRVMQEMDTRAEGDHQRGSHRLAEQLGERLHAPAVVPQSDQRGDRGPGDQAAELLDKAEIEHQQGQHKAQPDGRATQQRHGISVDFAGVGRVGHAKVRGGAPHQRRDEQHNRHRRQQHGRVLEDAAQITGQVSSSTPRRWCSEGSASSSYPCAW